MYDLGDVTVVPLVENPRLLIEPEEFFPRLAGDRSGWCFAEPWYDTGADRLVYAIRAFLVRAPDRTVLVDACVGDAKPRRRPEFDDQHTGWLDAAGSIGLDPDDVTDVVLTHLHVDHVGWATRRAGPAWEPVFARARHHVTAREYDYWTGPAGAAAMHRTGDYLADSVHPLRERGLLRLTAPNAAIGNRIRLVPAFGHTPGNVCVHVTGSESDLWLLGDALHHPLQLLRPDWSTRYCVDPAAAARTRRALLDRLAATAAPMLPAHFAYPRPGRVTRAGTGYTFEPET
ncbi:MBL fold metallo-hydrolase [Pseudonocardia acaciae]|uniref:MBL fold metallo-hydrolase n=1 Tax=Pseudonocardia acaciae TaxID=551276 RepID=UPI0006863269|nr:MBL fold metallo-hydrolase [Pseudonocardia acaciae]